MKLADYRKISPQINADLAAVFEKHGFKLKPFGAKIDELLGIVRMTLEAADVNHKSSDGRATTPEAEFYKQTHGLYDLKPEWLGAKFKANGTEYELLGMSHGRKAKCMLLKRLSDNTTRICTPEDVKRFFLHKMATANV